MGQSAAWNKPYNYYLVYSVVQRLSRSEGVRHKSHSNIGGGNIGTSAHNGGGLI